MDYRSYLVETDVSGDFVLDDWRWLVGPKLTLWRVTKAGDALLRDDRDGSIHLLDVMNGEIDRIADGDPAFESAVTAGDKAERWLKTKIVDRQAGLGMRPKNGECLSLKHPTVLGGQLVPENFESCDIMVHFSIAGQIHRQVKDMPPGQKIGKVTIEESSDARRPWWKFW